MSRFPTPKETANFVDMCISIIGSMGSELAMRYPGAVEAIGKSVGNFMRDESGAARIGREATSSKTAAEMGRDLAGKVGKNRVSARTAGGKYIDIDLQGKGHYDKGLGKVVETPHVHEGRITKGPNGLENIDKNTKITREATKQDIRNARNIFERRK